MSVHEYKYGACSLASLVIFNFISYASLLDVCEQRVIACDIKVIVFKSVSDHICMVIFVCMER